MMIFRYFPVLLVVLFASVSPAAAQEGADPTAVQALKNLQKLDQRLHAIGFRLTTENAAFCKDIIYRSGLLLHDIDQYGNKAAARAAHGFHTPISINAVAGINKRSMRSGDGLLSINQQLLSEIPHNDLKLEQEDPGYRRLAAINEHIAESMRIRSNFRNSNSLVRFLRGSEEMGAQISPAQACISRFQIRPDKDRQASADGKMVTITSALAEYTQSDDELAAIAAHELAHNLLKHKERLNAQKVNRGFFGQFGKSAGRIKQTEIEADRLSIWLMKNAGYDPQAATRFWTRYGKQHGKGIFSASTHYRWKKRVKLFEEEIAKMMAMEPVRDKYAPPLLVAADQ